MNSCIKFWTCGTSPRLASLRAVSSLPDKRVVSLPRTWMLPELALSSPARRLTSVVFPLPTGPARATNSPRFTRMLMSVKTSLRFGSRNTLLTWVSCVTVAVLAAPPKADLERPGINSSSSTKDQPRPRRQQKSPRCR